MVEQQQRPHDRARVDQPPSAQVGTSTTPDEAARRTATDVRDAHPDQVSPPRPWAAVVYNPTKIELDVLRAAADAAATEADWGDNRWYQTEADDPGVAMARQAVADGATMVIAVGGDGTVRAVTEGLLDTDVAMALLPMGTGNLLARNLDLMFDNIGDALACAFAGHDRAVDVGVVRVRREDGGQSEHAFLVMAGIGLDAQMVERTDDELKKRIGWLAYAKAIAEAARGGRRLHVRTRLDDGEPREGRVHSLLVGNCGTLPGDVLLLPEADLSDGLFDVIALRPKGPLGWLQIWAKVLVENKLLHRTEIGRRLPTSGRAIRTLRYETAARVRVRLEHPEPLEIDGDSLGEVVGYDTEMHPGGVRVQVPG